jgi:aryl-phospho-beta-D-glucosidase BglC (GH1 family)
MHAIAGSPCPGSTFGYAPLHPFLTLAAHLLSKLIVGEWTPAATDCAKYINGRGTGARYDGSLPGYPRIGSCNGLSGSASTFSAEYKTFLRQFWEAQVTTYELAANGWIQWTWKAENADEWAYQAGLLYGWIPANPTSRMSPGICG